MGIPSNRVKSFALTLFFAINTANLAFAEVFKPTRFVLENGLELVVIEDHRRPVVAHFIYYRVGSMDEDPGKTGLAHFLEHLMFKGTANIESGAFSSLVTKYGGRDNAFTSKDHTAYFQVVSSDKLGEMMEMEADRMTNLSFDDAIARSELAVVLEERLSRVENRPAGILYETLNAALYLSHPYRRPVIGWKPEISALTRADAMKFYRTWYKPNNAIVVISGDVRPEDALALAKVSYGKIPGGSLPSKQIFHEPEHTSPRRVIHEDTRVRQSSFQRLYLAPAYNGRAREPYALDVLAEVLGGETGTIYKALVIQAKKALNATFWYDGSGRDFGSSGIYALPLPGISLDTLEKEIQEVIEDLLQNGIAETEVEAAKNRLLAEAIFARDSLEGPARIVGDSLINGSTIDDVEAWPTRIQAVTKLEVDKAAKSLFRLERSATGWLIPKTASP
jgi:zinc protease